jgi:hypothetical protein
MSNLISDCALPLIPHISHTVISAWSSQFPVTLNKYEPSSKHKSHAPPTKLEHEGEPKAINSLVSSLIMNQAELTYDFRVASDP